MVDGESVTIILLRLWNEENYYDEKEKEKMDVEHSNVSILL